MSHVTPEPGPTGNPLIDVLRQRHPEVDVVVLPDPAVQRAAAESALPPDAVGDAVAPDAVVTEVATLAQSLATRLSAHPAWQAAEVARAGRWRRTPDDHHWFEAVVEVSGLQPGENVALLRAAGNALLGLGWLAAPVSGDRPRLMARRGSFRATATARPDGLVVTVSSGLMAGVDPEAQVVGS